MSVDSMIAKSGQTCTIYQRTYLTDDFGDRADTRTIRYSSVPIRLVENSVSERDSESNVIISTHTGYIPISYLSINRTDVIAIGIDRYEISRYSTDSSRNQFQLKLKLIE